jgi:hypothetical protein
MAAWRNAFPSRDVSIPGGALLLPCHLVVYEVRGEISWLPWQFLFYFILFYLLVVIA